MKAINNYLKRLHNRIKENKGTFILYTILRLMVLVALIRSIIIHNYEGAAVCVLTLVLFILPSFLAGSLQVEIPGLFQGIPEPLTLRTVIQGEMT